MKASDYIITTLIETGVSHVFEVCGGAITHLLNSIYGRDDITAVSMHHEMAAAIAAEGYARASGKIGVAMATSGPGATNLITGIGSCFFDSVPCLFLTGQVNTYEYKYERPIRQLGFQETDIVSIVRPIVKAASMISKAEDLQTMLSDLLNTAISGRPGPVLLDIPLNIQRTDINPNNQYSSKIKTIPKFQISGEQISEIIRVIKNSSRPLILAGGGVRTSDATKQLFEFAQISQIPVVVSLMGLDAFPHDDPLYVGMIGIYGHRYANLAIANADLIIALGTRLDTRQTGTKPETFARSAKIIHVDIDELELNNKKTVEYPLHADAKDFLSSMIPMIQSPDNGKYSWWFSKIKSYKTQYDIKELTTSGLDINPHFFLKQVSDMLANDAIVCVDVGQNQMWAAQAMNIKQGQRLLTQGGMASIGSALPLAIGAAFAEPGRQIVVITGDGGIQLNIQELQTIYHHQLPIKIILFNNCGYGLIRQFQEQYMESRFQSSVIGYSNPDFQRVANAYCIRSEKISYPNEIITAIEFLFCDENPKLLEVVINENYRVSPKLGVNKPIEDQEPLLSRDELKSHMITAMLNEEDNS